MESEKLSSKLHRREVTNCNNPADNGHWYFIWCPGCRCCHSIPVPRWSFNGNIDAPTFGPSVRLFTPAGDWDGDGVVSPERTTCHFVLADGIIQYCNDCVHALNGQAVPMQDIPEDYGT